MPLNPNYPKAVAFVIGDRPNGQRGAIGTAFLIRYPTRLFEGFVYYFVTAAHVVRGKDNLEVRLRNKSDGVCDLHACQWFEHPTDDVAISFAHAGRVLAHDVATIPFADFIDQRGDNPDLGDDVFFLGLLADIPEMEASNIPMVRSGSLGAYFQAGVPIALANDLVVEVVAHLIDCRSYQGFSGSPCFVQFIRANPTPNVILQTYTYLLGVVSGHFDKTDPLLDPETDPLEDYRGGVKVPIHTGVGVVTPVERLTELLQSDEVVDARSQAEEEFLKSKGDEGGGSLDRQ